MADTGVTVIGAGVVGLAVAARLAPRHPTLVLLERNPRHGLEASSRNSEVIHAGIYYPTGSLKARLCVRGNLLLYDLCARYQIPHMRMGKIIVATDPQEIPALDDLWRLGTANGVELRRLSAAEVKRLEPNVHSVGGLSSPHTGVVSAHSLMDALLQEARQAGAIFQTHSEVIEIERRSADYHITVRSGETLESFTSERVINAAGLESDRVASLAGINVDTAGYRLHYCKGSYFSLAPSRAGLVSRLVYPVPSTQSLGIHAVIDVAGRLRFGPDTEYLGERRLDYRVDESRRPRFGESIRRYLPSVKDEDLEPDISGIRAKLQGPRDGFRDFVIAEETTRSLPGFFSIVGIDSPGLTAAPAIAEHVASMTEGQ